MISVVMPAYNAARFIGKAVASIQTQTMGDFELIVVDDGSTDDTRHIVEELAREDSRIRVINGEHQGISDALNRGIDQARFPWIAIMHADDVALPKRLEAQFNASQAHPNVVVWGTHLYHVDAQERVLGISKTGPASEAHFHELRRNAQAVVVAHPSAFLKKEIWEKAGKYDPRFDGTEDMELFDRMAEFGAVVAIPEPLMLYRIHASSVTMNRFMKMRQFSRYVRERQRARLHKRPIPTFEEFTAQRRQAPPIERLRRYLDDISQLHYRKAGLAHAEKKRLKCLLHFGASTLFNPAYSLKRIRDQLFWSAKPATQDSTQCT